ncbi:MAG TPA: NYN domain-containing protein [Solirubrobacteraceae bacterium]|nr:NYN domain-containing protein [Solirubrobacteraceae bacterium]
MQANVYVDGFNLYYSALRRRFPDCKWLDVRRLAEMLFPQDEIRHVVYFSARVIARSDDPQEATRQQMYFRALAARDVEIVLGQFRSAARWMRRSEPCPRGEDCPVSAENIRVVVTEEKGSDVNLASRLLIDAFRRDCEMAIVLTNDTDLVEPIRVARDELGLRLALLTPSENPARSLRGTVDVLKKLRHGSLQASQLPDLLRDERGEIHRPRAWRAA